MWCIKVYNNGMLLRIRFYHDRESAMKVLFDRLEELKQSFIVNELQIFEDRFCYTSGSIGNFVSYDNRVEYVDDITKLGWL